MLMLMSVCVQCIVDVDVCVCVQCIVDVDVDVCVCAVYS